VRRPVLSGYFGQQVRDRVAEIGEPAHGFDHGQAELSDEQRWFRR
jgi:hypothetical protein